MRADPGFLVDNRDRAGIFLDFDGTLSEIVDVPSEARPTSGVRELLGALSDVFALVAIVSGRRSDQLVAWLGGDVEIWGVHGAERALHGGTHVHPDLLPFVPVLERARVEAERALSQEAFEGCLVEDKGTAIALHYRMATASDAGDRLRELADELAKRHGLDRTDARMAFELRPPVDVSKGAVVVARARELDLRAVVFLGDDVVDLVAFDALDELEGEGRATLRVAVDSKEAPPELLARADLVVGGVDGVVDWLSRIARLAAEA